jgi:diadenosine tetraphosphatase ApaH/serine/threonine PP2A family protein phosphatase
LNVVSQAVSVLQREGAVLDVSGSVVVVGDIHGNLATLVRIFDEFGYPDSVCFVFLGDYIDRGPHSCEVLIFLYSLKILFPQNVILLRGNHEVGDTRDSCGFRRECLARFLPRVYSSIVESFSYLPIAVIINKRVFCVHGGLTPNLDIRSLNKGSEGVLWSDPRSDVDGFRESDRGRGFHFGRDAVEEFLKREGFELLIRSHEYCEEGFSWPFGEKCGCLTIFSSVDYCGEKNDGSVCVLKEGEKPKVHRLSYHGPTVRRRSLIPLFILESNRSLHGWSDLFGESESELLLKSELSF